MVNDTVAWPSRSEITLGGWPAAPAGRRQRKRQLRRHKLRRRPPVGPAAHRRDHRRRISAAVQGRQGHPGPPDPPRPLPRARHLRQSQEPPPAQELRPRQHRLTRSCRLGTGTRMSPRYRDLTGLARAGQGWPGLPRRLRPRCRRRSIAAMQATGQARHRHRAIAATRPAIPDSSRTHWAAADSLWVIHRITSRMRSRLASAATAGRSASTWARAA
jgi:hypothetical protein